MKFFRLLFLLMITAMSFMARAQVRYEVLNYSLRSHNQWLNFKTDDSLRQSSFYGNLYSDLHGGREPYNSYAPVNAADSAFLINRKYQERSWFHRKLLKEHFIIIDTGLFYVTIDPLFNVSAGKTESQENEQYNSSIEIGEYLHQYKRNFAQGRYRFEAFSRKLLL